MNRLQKKCFFASAGFHLLLAIILLVGPAFLSSKTKSEDMPILDYIPSKLVDAAMMGGGNPKANPPPPAPAPTPTKTVVTPAPEKVREPEPPKEISPPKDAEPDFSQPKKQPKKKLPEVSTTPVIRKNSASKTAKPDKQLADTQESKVQQLADARRRLAESLSSTARSLRKDLSSSTVIDMDYGPGGGGPAYANYAQAIRSIYEHAWIAPEDTATENAITKVTVTIASDGSLISARILEPSGDSLVDKSVERTLARVTHFPAFPDGAKETQRTYTIYFDLKAKRLLG